MDNTDLFRDLKNEIEIKGIIAMKVVGVSMEPLIAENSKVIVKKIANLSQVKKFDIVVFRQEGKFICHYFWKRNQYFNSSDSDPTIITRPLNPIAGYDHPISFEDIVGKVVNYKISFKSKSEIYIKTSLKNYLSRD